MDFVRIGGKSCFLFNVFHKNDKNKTKNKVRNYDSDQFGNFPQRSQRRSELGPGMTLISIRPTSILFLPTGRSD